MQGYFKDRRHEFDSILVYETSNWIANEVKLIAMQQGMGFVDPREALRLSGKLVHGPKDYKHFNKAGYEILTTAILNHLQSAVNTK